jgi:malto-oligosyltrehalose trehalohydrolase
MLNPSAPVEGHAAHAAVLHSDGSLTFRLRAPAQSNVLLAITGHRHPYAMDPLTSTGWHELTLPQLGGGTRYAFVLPDGTRVPDPASHFQPGGMSGPSELVDPRTYGWRDRDWKGKPWQMAVLYDLHVGTFTPEGTFRGVLSRLDHLMDLGMTAIELMPVAASPKRRNWGYDGAFPCDATYGRPDELKALVDAVHARGLMILLDVVYNHFGPEGNYKFLYAPQFFSERHHTPWGAGINFDGPESAAVREFFFANAIHWLEEFHFDGLRLDAVHALLDDSDRHFLDELSARMARELPGRQTRLILESEKNPASRLLRQIGGTPAQFTAQWNDDVHHLTP